MDIKYGYFCHCGNIVNVKIITCLGIRNKRDRFGNGYITVTDDPKINYRNALYASKNFKIISCEDTKGRSKNIKVVNKYIQDKTREQDRPFTIYFRIEKEIVFAECINYLFFNDEGKLKNENFPYNHSGYITLYDDYGRISDVFYNDSGRYEGNRKIYENGNIKYDFNYRRQKKWEANKLF